MNLDYWVILGLGVLNAVQFVFWGYQNQVLVNKLMCRNYAEYDLIVRKPELEVLEHKEPRDFEEDEILNELNSRLRGA